MTKPLVSDELWARIEPLLPAEKPRRFRFSGRKPIDRRKVLTGIVFVLKTGIAWDDLPAELGWGCGRTCREALAAWQRAGVWDRLHEILPDELGDPGLIDWSRALVERRLLEGPQRGRADRPEPDGPPQEGEQAPRDHRRRRSPAGDRADRGPAARHDADAPAGQRDPADPGAAGPAATSPRPGPRRPRLPLEGELPRAAEAPDRAGPGAARDAARQRPGEDALVCRADAAVAPSVWPPSRQVGPPARDPARLDGTGMLADLLATLTVGSYSHFFRWLLA